MNRPSSKAFTWRAVFALVLLVPATLAALLSRPLIREGTLMDVCLEGLGWLVFLGGGAFRVWATLYIGGRKGKTVIRRGPYSLCRHPLYVGSFLVALSASLFLMSPTLFVGIVLVGVAYLGLVIPAEERHLLAELGEAYSQYQRSTPGLLPNPWGFRNGGTIEVQPKALRIEVKRAMLWVLIPVACEIVSYFRVLPWWPHLLRLP